MTPSVGFNVRDGLVPTYAVCGIDISFDSWSWCYYTLEKYGHSTSNIYVYAHSKCWFPCHMKKILGVSLISSCLESLSQKLNHML